MEQQRPEKMPLQRFSQRYTAFARANWDETSEAYQKRRRSFEGRSTRRRRGYRAEDFALNAGAWAMHGQIGRARARLSDIASPLKSHEGSLEPAVLTRHLKRAARLYGADLVGVARVNPLWIYASDAQERPIELPEGMDTAVVIAVAMDYELTRTSPAVPASAATGNGYSRMDFTAICVAEYLRKLGWRAIPCGNDTALSIPLAIDAGLGELGRNGLLITEPYGPRVRLCKVFTDAPLVPDQPRTFGVETFCEVCLKCADTCPSRSIPRGGKTWEGPTPSNNPGALKWYVHPDKCLAFWRVNGVSCANCIRSCPFNKRPGKLHDLARRLIRLRSRMIDRVLVWLDDRLGYGTQVFPNH